MTDSVGKEENPHQAEYLKHLYRGSELLLNDKIVEARETLEQASRIDPDDPKCLSLLGLVYFRLDDYEPAQQIYELLVQRFPEEASLRVNLGLVYMKQGHADKALEEMNRGVAIDPEHQRAYGYLGLLHSDRGDYRQAREAFRMAGQEAMVLRMDEIIAADGAGEAPVMAELTAEALPPDPDPFGSPTGPLEPVAPPETAPASEPAGPAPGSPPPVDSVGPAPGSPPPVDSVGPAPGSPPPVDSAGPAPGSPPPVGPAASAAPDEQMRTLTSDGQTLPVEAPAPMADASEPVAGAPVAAEPTLAEPTLAEPTPEEPSATAADLVAPEAEGPGPYGENGFDDEIDAVINEAVAPREPWPSESGLLPAASPAEEVPSQGLTPSAEPAAVEPGQPTPAAGASGKSVPIFSYATADLIDLSARVVRMRAPQANTLIFPVEEDGFIRAEALTAHVGDLTFEDARRRAKGQFTEEPMVDSRGRFIKVLGDGVLLCDAGNEQVTVLDLFDDFLYLRTELLFAFESTLHWENGKVRGAAGPIELIHIRGEGRLALVGADKLRKVRLVPECEAYVSEEGLVGWMGRVSPQTLPRGAAAPEASVLKPMLRCEGEGVILVRSTERLVEAVRED